MPTYDYECDACGHTFEHWQTMTSNRLRKCPGCGLRKLRRLIGSGGGVIFKGSGFYETDYKAKKRPASGTDDGESSSSGDEPAKKDDAPGAAGEAAEPKKPVDKAKKAKKATKSSKAKKD